MWFQVVSKILVIIKEKGFKDDYIKVSKELTLYMNGGRANVVVKLH